MNSKTLSKSHHYLQNKSKAKKLLIRSIASSTAIETGESITTIEAKINRPHSAGKRIKLA